MQLVTRTVENAIARFCQMEGLKVRRKTSINGRSHKTSWWFVIHADESILHELDEKWDTVNLQTNWILKRCTKPAAVSTVEGAPTNTSNDASELTPANATGTICQTDIVTATPVTDTPEPLSSQLQPSRDPRQAMDHATDQPSPSTSDESEQTPLQHQSSQQ